MDDDDFAEHDDGIDALLSEDVAMGTSPDNPPASSCANGWLVPARPEVQSKASRRSVLDFTKDLYTADQRKKGHTRAVTTTLKDVSKDTRRLLIARRNVYAVRRVLLLQRRRARAVVP